MGRKKRDKPAEEYRPVAELLSSVHSEDVLLLDITGSPEEVQANFKTYVYKAREWCYKNGIRVDASRICGRKKHVFTTPIKKTLYTVVKYKNDTITFIKQGRYWWEKGYCTGGKAYELMLEQGCKNYIECADTDHITLSFGGNHRYISNGDPGGSLTGLSYLRKVFTAIVEGKGRIDPTLVGLFVIYLAEAPTFEVIFKALYENILIDHSYRLDFFVPNTTTLVHRWSKLSTYAMEYMHCLREGKELPELDNEIALPGLSSIQEILESVKILQLDGYNDGIFIHEPTQHPDPEVWSATDNISDRKKKYEKSAAAPKGSIVQINESMFHMLNINGKVESLYAEQPPSSALKLNRGHGLFSNKETGFSRSNAKRRTSTSGYANEILDTPKDKLLQASMVKRPHFSIKNTSLNEDFFLKGIRLTAQRHHQLGYPPKEKVCCFGGTTPKNASERFIASRILTRRMLMLKPLVLGMHVVHNCPEWRTTVPGIKGQGHDALHQFIPLSPQGPKQGFTGRITSLISKLRQCWRS